MNEVPIQQFYALPYDRWEGYEAERRKLLDFIANNAVKNAVFLTTDVHANLVNTIKFSTLGEGGPPVDTGIFDVTTGPVATMTFTRSRTARGTRAGDLIRASSSRRPAERGGDELRELRRVQLRAGHRDRSALTVVAKDIKGRPVKEDASTAGPMRAYVIPQREPTRSAPA